MYHQNIPKGIQVTEQTRSFKPTSTQTGSIPKTICPRTPFAMVVGVGGGGYNSVTTTKTTRSTPTEENETSMFSCIRKAFKDREVPSTSKEPYPQIMEVINKQEAHGPQHSPELTAVS